MKKRLLAFMCVLAILAGMVVVPASAAGAENNTTYRVGYAKRDINPWIDLQVIEDGESKTIGIPANQGLDADGKPIPYTDANTNIVTTEIHDPLNLNGKPIPVQIVSLGMGGYGNSAERHAACMTDDNGDGYISYGDGIYVTCTAVTDSNDKTVLYLTLDLTGVSETVTDKLRNLIVESLNGAVTKDAIMINANHSHSSMNIVSTKKGTALKAYYEYMYDRVVEAAEAALADRAKVEKMSKGSIESSAAMRAMGYTDANGNGVVMNRVRHTKTDGYLQIKEKDDSGAFSVSWQNYKDKDNGKVIYTPLIQTSHSGGGPVFKDFDKKVGPDDNPISSDYNPTNKEVKYKFQVKATGQSVSQVDETLHVLQFDRVDEKSGVEKKPVVMINWRGHSTLNGGGGANKNLSSDYANSLRYRLENNKTVFKGNSDYCVAFWQGASGNVNSGDYDGLWKTAESTTHNVNAEVKVVKVVEEELGDTGVTIANSAEDPYGFYKEYYDTFTDAYNDNRFFYGARYGYLLAKIALTCMNDNNMKDCNIGAIRTKQVVYQATRQQFSYGEYLAAVKWSKSKYVKAESNKNYVYPYWYDVDTDVDGVVERYILNSSFHAKSVLEDYPKIDSDTDGKNLIPVEMQTKVPIEINAIMMGDNVAIVTLPGEPFDRYSEGATLDDTSDNDWEDLISENLISRDTYGEPFVLGYSNGRAGYLPNTLAYDYLSHLREDLTSKTDTFDSVDKYKNFLNVFAAGSYESNTADVERGTGEKLVAKLGEMLAELAARRERCEDCDETVDWKPLTNDTIMEGIYESGHYYLEEDLTTYNAPVKTINGTMKVCLDLNGKHYTNNGRIFELSDNGVLNIMDSGEGGTITAKSGGSNTDGGMMVLTGYGTLNMYGGTLKFVRDEEYLNHQESMGESCYETRSGGVITAKGFSTINLYGGTIQGGEMAQSANSTSTVINGATIRLTGKPKLNVSGGRILAGKAVEGGSGDCVYASDDVKFNISGNAVIDELYCSNYTASKLTVTGDYTGTTNVRFAPSVELANGLDVGNVNDTTSLKPGALTCVNEGNYRFDISGTDLVLNQVGSVTALIGQTEYPTLQSAIDAYDVNDGYIEMIKDADEDITVNKDVYVDLNGNSIKMVSAINGGKLHCLDSRTDDYQIEGNSETGYYGYGKVKEFSEGAVTAVAMEDEMTVDSYLMVTEEDGASFHRVNLQITAMTLRPQNDGETGYNPSVYYKSAFKGDQLVAENVKQFGIAMSLVEEPTAENFGTTNLCSAFTAPETPFVAGANGNAGNSTLLKNILKESNPKLGNIRNSQLPVYGRAYVLTNDDELVFGSCVSRNFQEQVEGANQLDVWNNTSKDTKHALQQMCDTYRFMMVDWEIDNIKSMIPESEERVLKVLTLGHSLALDANHMLNLVANKQGLGDAYDEMVIGSLYYSGCHLWRHAKNLYENTPEYSLYVSRTTNTEYGLHDKKSKTSVNTIADAIDYDYWDIIIMQGGVFEIGKDDTYTDGNIQIIQNYIEKHKRNPEAKLAWNMTWCPPIDEDLMSDSYKESYKYFGSDREEMYGKITGCVQKYILEDENYKFIIPSATVFENALASGLTEKKIHRDYVHATDLSRLMASYAFYCRIMGVDQLDDIKVNMVPKAFSIRHKLDPVPEKDWVPNDWTLTSAEKDLIRETVNNALKTPFAVTRPQNTEAQ